MVANRHNLGVLVLAFVSTLPWPTLFLAALNASDGHRGLGQGTVSACDPDSLVAAIPIEREPLVKGERAWPAVPATAIPIQDITTRVHSSPADSDKRTAIPRDCNLTCALLCKFVV
jgi:hypothetical protein